MTLDEMVSRFEGGTSCATLAAEVGKSERVVFELMRPYGEGRSELASQRRRMSQADSQDKFLKALYGLRNGDGIGRGVSPRSPRRVVPDRWGYPFWEVVRDFAEQGLSRAQVAKAIGYSVSSFMDLLLKNPESDPFEPANIVANYVRDSGESLKDALAEMAARGFTISEAARFIGYEGAEGLRYAMKARGIPDPGFQRKKAKAQPAKQQWKWVAERKPTGLPHPWRIADARSWARHCERHNSESK